MGQRAEALADFMLNQSTPAPATQGERSHWRLELSKTLRLAIPIVLTQLAWVAMMTTDTAMMGRLGAEALAGASLGMMTFFLVWVFCFGVVMATAALAAQAFGARQPRIVRRVVRQGLWVTIVLTTPGVVLLSFTPDFLAYLGQPPEALPHAAAYMETLKWSLPPAIAFAVIRNFVSALNRPMSAMWVMFAGVPLNAALDYGLIFGNLGLPRLELMGAGIATTAVNAAMFLTLLAFVVLKRPFARYAVLGRFWRPDWGQFRAIFRIGLPIAGTSLLEGGYFIGSIFFIGKFGSLPLAATMIAMQLPHISFMVPMGLAQAATVRVGHAVGRRDVQGAYRAGWMALAMALGFMSMMTVVVLIVPELFASAFLDGARADSAEVLALAVTYLFFAAFFQAGDGIQAVAAGALRGLNDTAAPMVIAAICYWGIGLGSGLWLAFAAGMEGSGLWIGFVIGLTCAAIVLAHRFRRQEARGYIPAVASG
jgi:MATE family multidrug resistance protein